MRGIGNSYISWMSHGFQFPRLKKCLKPRARNLAAIHEQPDVDEVNCWIVDFLHTFLKKEPKWNSNLRFSLFHWTSYNFLSSTKLTVPPWRLKVGKWNLIGYVQAVYIYTCFFLFVLSILPRESSKLMPRRELSREDFHALYSAELADAWCIPSATVSHVITMAH